MSVCTTTVAMLFLMNVVVSYLLYEIVSAKERQDARTVRVGVAGILLVVLVFIFQHRDKLPFISKKKL